MVDPVRVRSRKKGRQEAIAMLEIIDETVGEYLIPKPDEDGNDTRPQAEQDFAFGFWQQIFTTAADRQPDARVGQETPALTIEPLSDADFHERQQERVGYGRHMDDQWRNMPVDYLALAVRSAKRLLQYAEHPAIKQKLEAHNMGGDLIPEEDW